MKIVFILMIILNFIYYLVEDRQNTDKKILYLLWIIFNMIALIYLDM